ncbi:MAG: hypothetical protein RIQ53_4064 [Pseudomonadota bacterium]
MAEAAPRATLTPSPPAAPLVRAPASPPLPVSAAEAPAAAHPAAGLALMLLATACFAGMDTAVRELSSGHATGGLVLPVVVMLWWRYLAQGGLMGLWFLARRRPLRIAHPKFQLMRGLLLMVSTVCSFLGLRHLPVPEFTAVVMLAPVLATALAAFALGERVSAGRWALVAGAMVGALIIIRPGGALFGPGALYPLAGALAFGSFQVLTRRLASLEDPYATHLCTGWVGVIIGSAWLLAQGLTPWDGLDELGPGPWAILAMVGLLGTIGHLVLILALGQAPASLLMPFSYSQIAWATLMAWLVAGHWPDDWSWVGIAVITGCGATSAWLNLRRPAATNAVQADTVTD